MNYKIRSYSTYDNWTVTTKSKNVSDIMSKMVERAGRICERYASDIFYNLADYDHAVQTAEKYDKVLCFRENGVNTWGVRDDMIHNTYLSSEFIQYWRLRWNPNTEYGSFIRVTLRPIKEE